MSDETDAEIRLSTIISLVVGVIFVAMGFWLRDREAKELATMTEVKGVVVESTERRDRDKKVDLYAPIVEFEVNGVKHRVTGREETSQQAEGNVAVVRFDPAAPDQTARIIGSLEGLVPASVLALGGFSFLAGLRGLFRRRR